MATRPPIEVLQRAQDILLSSPLQDPPKAGEDEKSHGLSIEKRIEFLENLAGKVRNRRSRRWLNDRLLMELVPRLNAEEIRGLFAPPPWGDDVPLSPFCMTNVGEWDKFRNIDMDKQANKNSINSANERGCTKVADFSDLSLFYCNVWCYFGWFWPCIHFFFETRVFIRREDGMIKALKGSSSKRKGHVDADKIAVLNAWHRVNCRTREALRRSFLSELIEGYEECLRAFIKDSGDGDVLVLHVQDPFRRLLLHGVCEFYNLVSVTVTQSKDSQSFKTTKIKKKKSGSVELPNITLSHFLKMSKEGIW